MSQLVRDECSGGDATAAAERLAATAGLEMVEIEEDAQNLADQLIAAGAIPATEPRDALHIAIAASNGIQYLVTWNFKHIANAAMRSRIEHVCSNAGFAPPIICTPEELSGEIEHDPNAN